MIAGDNVHTPIRLSDLQIGIAQTPQEVQAAQRLRYQVFHEELGAKSNSPARLDTDPYDDFCDHLKVTKSGSDELIGTYRLLRQSVAAKNIGFYSQNEFDIEPLLQRKADLSFLELSRSCVLKPFRGKAVLELLWQGIWDYVRANNVDVMLGCASFPGTNIVAHAEALSFLAQHASAPPEWQVRAHDKNYALMNTIPQAEINKRRALLSLPALIKAYLRLGCYIGDGAVIDYDFNTIDVFIILPVANINPKYFGYYGDPNH
jgi:L-ornithine Nalpha-acyltransferase